MSSIYLNIFYAAVVCAIFFFALAIVLFISLNIPKVIGDITGRTSRKGIEKMRELNESSGVKAYKTSPVNLQRGTVTDEINGNENKKKIVYGEVNTVELPHNNSKSSETTILSREEQKNTFFGDTTILGDMPETNIQNTGTTVLNDSAANLFGNPVFTVEEEIIYSESNEIII